MLEKSVSFRTKRKRQFKEILGIVEVRKTIGDIEIGESVHYRSRGAWSMHQLIGYLAEKMSGCDLYVCSWALSEDAARALVGLKIAGKIDRIFAIFDHRIKERNSASVAYLSLYVTGISFPKVHAKSYILIGENDGYTIDSSANLSRNDRIENGVITRDRGIAQMGANWLLEELMEKL
jgi:hypothetical protein